MGVAGGPDMIENGLVLSLDAADRNSYVSGSTNWFDLSGNNNGTLTNGPTFNSGDGGSIVFDGTNDYILVNSTSTLTPGSGDFTIDFWINPINNAGPYGPIFVANNTNGIWVGRKFNDFVIRAYNVDDRLLYNVLPTQNVWSYVTVGRTGTTLFLYYNGINVSTSTSSQNFIQSDIYLGSDGYPGAPVLYTGKISNIRYYNRALSQKEITQNYNATKARFGL